MTANNQINALVKIGCEEAILEIRNNHNRPLSDARLKRYIRTAIENGFVVRANTLAEIGHTPLSSAQLGRLIKECLKRGWVVDALHAARLGNVSKASLHRLITALVTNKLATDREEAMSLLSETA